tara:strand:+ start:615 stop:797 length:183 start_codon:yes stop_codon:yes gene_type:complete
MNKDYRYKNQKKYIAKHKCIWLSETSHQKLSTLAESWYRTKKGQLELLIDNAYAEMERSI